MTTSGITSSVSDTDYITISLDGMMNGTSASDLYTISGSTDTITWSNDWITTSTSHNTLDVKGDANIEGELIVQGVKLSERLDKIEEKLAILHPNPELEEKWENLRGLRKAYMELEAEIIEKEKMWAILQK